MRSKPLETDNLYPNTCGLWRWVGVGLVGRRYSVPWTFRSLYIHVHYIYFISLTLCLYVIVLSIVWVGLLYDT